MLFAHHKTRHVETGNTSFDHDVKSQKSKENLRHKDVLNRKGAAGEKTSWTNNINIFLVFEINV